MTRSILTAALAAAMLLFAGGLQTIRPRSSTRRPQSPTFERLRRRSRTLTLL